MPTVKYQVFVSSTYEDLKEERSQIIKAALESGNIPVGMEMFSAADEEQWEIIKRTIDECDYYVVIVAHRYGSMTADGISFTEKEYDYAVQQGIPVLGFVLDSNASWPGNRRESDVKKQEALASFIEKVKKKPVGFWSTGDQLHGMFIAAFVKATTTRPRPGWIRATGATGPEVANELSRLSSENADLRAQLSAFQLGSPQPFLKVQFQENREKIDTLKILDLKSAPHPGYPSDAGYSDNTIELIFSLENIGKTMANDIVVDIELPKLCRVKYPGGWFTYGDHANTVRSSDTSKGQLTLNRLVHNTEALLDSLPVEFPSTVGEYEIKWTAHAGNMVEPTRGILRVQLGGFEALKNMGLLE